MNLLNFSAIKKRVTAIGREVFCPRSEPIYTADCDTDIPTWINAEADVEIARDRKDQRISYITTFREPATRGPLQVTPSQEFRTLNITLVDVDPTLDFTVTVTFETTNGNTEQHELTYTNGEFNLERIIPITITSEKPATAARITVTTTSNDPSRDKNSPVTSLLSKLKGGDVWNRREYVIPSLSLPSVGMPDEGIPIFLISIDTLRYDFLDRLDTLINTLGENAKIPSEPRTQGSSTWPSHASMLTGVHPRRHGCHGGRESPQIDPSLVTLPEALAQAGYKCSGLVSSGNLLPERGFARGFHRYEYQPMSWEDREYDARTNVDTLLNWLAEDLSYSHNHFYFLHLFDAHYPYLPPFPLSNMDIDVRLVEQYLEQNDIQDYVKLVKEDPLDINSSDIERLKTYYSRSLEHISEQLVRFVNTLKRAGVFEKSFIIITGDHGEDFYERNFILHRSLYDQNIRPGMIIKPPAGAPFTVPDTPDLVDFYPTIRQFTSTNTSNKSDGQSWYSEYQQEPRIAEQFGEWYNISVEINGKKGVFTYKNEVPNRPRSRVNHEPILEEFYDIERVRAGVYNVVNHKLTEPEKQKLRQISSKFIDQDTTGAAEGQERKLPAEVSDRLEKLGYK